MEQIEYRRYNPQSECYEYRNAKRELHRDDDKPAKVCVSGHRAWYRNNQLYRDDNKPTIIDECGGKYYLKGGSEENTTYWLKPMIEWTPPDTPTKEFFNCGARKIHSIFDDDKPYREVEFVCHNSTDKSSTSKDKQRMLYEGIKRKCSNKGAIPYMQDFSEGNEEQISLAVIFEDIGIEDDAFYCVLEEAQNYGVEIDLTTEISNKKVDEVKNGTLEFLIK